MHDLPRRLPWVLVGCAVAFVGAASIFGSLPDPGWRWAVGVVAVSVAVFAYRSAVPPLFAAIFLLATLRVVSRKVPDSGLPRLAEISIEFAVGVLLCLLILAAFQCRNGRFTRRDILDIAAVAIGTGVIGWLAIAHPLIDSGAAPWSALLLAGCLPIASLLVVLTVDIAFSGLTHNRTMWFASGAAIIHLGASWVWAFRAVDRLPDGAADFATALNVAALCGLGAALCNPDAHESLAPLDRKEVGSDSVMRIVILGTSVLVPVSLVATVAPSSAADVIVRATGIALLVVAVVARLLIAVRESRRTREILLQQVTRDDLTRLPNRSRFIDDVADVLETTWHSATRATVVQLNLDRFKNINDNFGHYAANEVLVEIAGRLRSVAATDGSTVARVGGDDFAFVLGDTTSAEEALARADSIRSALDVPVTVGDVTVFVTASIGVAIAPRNRTTAAEDLMRHADIAAHRAKQNGRNRIELFDESMQANLTRRMDVEHALHGAIGRQEMRLHHQPIVDITSGRVSGFEALLRWQRQDGTLVSPADFIPVAEETGIICELGAWALLDALRALRQWIDGGLVPPSATMSVNVSPRQIADPNFPEVVRCAIVESGVPAELLWLEITESMMLEEPELAATTLNEIRAQGVRIALDDFGTGYSSLSLLQQFPIQRIKIDRAFVQGIAEAGNDRSLVRTIIAMARSMALDLVAEGVETVQQLEVLRDLGCDKSQGFLISRPVPAEGMGSTMVALEQLASLSLFDRSDSHLTTTSVVAAPARPARQFASVGPIGPMGARPLGGPML